MARLIQYAPEQDQTQLRFMVKSMIEQALAQEDPNVQQKVLSMIQFAPPEEERTELIRQAFACGLGHQIIKPSLYDNSNLSTQRFQRKKFPKTGSETTLIGGLLQGKVIVRHILPLAFHAWQSAYEAYQIWQKFGWDYVPIEPICAYRMNQRGLVDVYTGVLDLNLAQWLKVSGGMFQKELGEMQKNILSVLDFLGITHKHPHNANFVLRFHRDPSGNPLLYPIPRLYIIDFDEAEI